MTIREKALCAAFLVCLSFLFSQSAFAEDTFSIQVGDYPSLESALQALDDLKDNRIYCDTRQKGKLYAVECGPFATEEEAKVLREKLVSLGYKESLVVKPVPAAMEVTAGKEGPEEKPAGTEKKAGVFGIKGGNIHPFLSVAEYYTDNFFNTKDNKKSDWYTVLSPGVWLLVPRIRDYVTDVTTTTVSPGGLSLTRFVPRYSGRYQAYLLYRADIELHPWLSSQNTTSQLVLGALQYNFRGGLTLDLVEQYVKSHDPYGTGGTNTLNKYHTNLIGMSANYETNSKWQFRADYANFLVKYLDATNDFRNRMDNALYGYVFYKITPKTSVFVEYDFVDINYDLSNLSDSKEHRVYGGIAWDISAKSKGEIKGGYGVKDFSDPTIPKGDSFLLEAQINYSLTPRTSVSLVGGRRMNETDIAQTGFVITDYINVGYSQHLTNKLSANANLSYWKDRYQEDYTLDNVTQKLTDTYYGAGVWADYRPREWFKASLGYNYTRRSSNFSVYDYTNNSFFLKITGSL